MLGSVQKNSCEYIYYHERLSFITGIRVEVIEISDSFATDFEHLVQRKMLAKFTEDGQLLAYIRNRLVV